MLKKIFLTGLIVVGFGVGDVFATSKESVTTKPMQRLQELAATPTDTDMLAIFDASAGVDKKIDTSRFTFNAEINAFTAANTHAALESFALGLTSTAQTVTPDAVSAGTITAGVTAVDVAAVTNDADDWIVLPAIAGVPVGHTITIGCNAGTAFEIRTPSTSGELINSVDADGTQEWVAIDTNIVIVRKLSDVDGWILLEYDTLGVVVAAHAPN